MVTAKKNIRIELKKILNGIDDSTKQKTSAQISLILLRLFKFFESPDCNLFPNDFLIGVYAPLVDEVNWANSLAPFFNRLCYPRFISARKMEFCLSRPDELVVSKSFGVEIFSPKKEAKVEVPSVLIIPGLGFSTDGKRLGRGAGFYDQYLNSFKGLKIGICFEQTLKDNIPIEKHDIFMDIVISGKNMFVIDPSLEPLRRKEWN